ncbi:MAG TPA: hypothetical protein DIU15_04655 [Deltaproteobacteria bacterium]|nr:hypothetical protein [Deltaproteobacteria bacterium]HCP45305.1 hypothetical protein [Deltaproteobacteria bacterium]
MPPRRRRSPEQARAEILEAAERQMRAVGPGGLRLQEVADEAGLSHPSILHYFGTRRGLVDAVVERGVQRLEADLFELLSQEEGRSDTEGLLQRVAGTLTERGHARLLAWLVLTGEGEPLGTEHTLQAIAQAVHANRVAAAAGTQSPPTFEDTVFVVLLAGLTVFGDALLGTELRRSAGLGDDASAGERFHSWLAQLLAAHSGPTHD